MPTTAVHLVTGHALPFPGGMEESIERIATGLADDGIEVTIYTLQQPLEHRKAEHEHPLIALEHLGDERELLLAPFQDGGPIAKGEESRANYMFLRTAIERRMLAEGGRQHVVLSFYVVGVGSVTQLVATSLGLPHIASARGTDVELGIHDTQRRPQIRLVAEGAAQILTTNEKQSEMLSGLFRVRRPIRTIHNALEGVADRPLWTPPPADTVRLVSDCGFSGRKATHLLMRAVESLVEKGLPVSLTVLGGIYHYDHDSYWEELREGYRARYPEAFHFPGRVTAEEVDSALLESHIYCSATLAEGCSNSRIRALTSGIPIVTTRCGAIPEVAAGCGHVRLCPPGDWRELAHQLELAVAETRPGTLRPDPKCIARWREHFSVARERREWRAAISGVLEQ